MNETFGVGRALGLTFSIWFKNFIPFTVIAVLLSAPEILYLVVESGKWGGEFDLAQLIELSSFERNLTLLGIFCTLLVTPPLTYGVVMELKGGHASMGACIGVGLKRFFPVLGTTILLGIIMVAIMFVAGLLAVGLGIIGLIAGLCFLAVIYCIYYVAIPAAVIERPGVAGALSRSADLTRGRRGGIFGMLLLVIGLRIVINLILQDVLVDEQALMENPDRIWGMLKNVYWAHVVVGIISSLIAGVLAAVTYYLLRNEKEGTSADELAAVFD